jgi:hypothetical protein
MFKFFVILLLLLILMATCMGCAAVPAVSSLLVPTEGYTTYKTVTTIKVGTDITLTATTGKASHDIVLSKIVKRDCTTHKLLTTGRICEKRPNINYGPWTFISQ